MEPSSIALFQEAALSSPIAWAGLLTMLGSVYVVSRLAARSSLGVAFRAWRRSASGNWVERARVAWPARRVGRLAPPLLAGGMILALGRDGRLVELIPRFAANVLIGSAAFLGGLHAAIDWGRRINPSWALTPRPERGAWISCISWVGPLIVLGLVLYSLAPPAWDGRASALLVFGTTTVGLYLAWGWRRLLRWTGVIGPAGDRLRGIATRAAGRAGVELRSIEQAALPMVNAFAFVFDQGIAVTDAAVAVLDDDELGAVCAHELAHLAEPRWVLAVRLAYGFLWGLIVTSLGLIRPVLGSLSWEVALLILSFGLAGLLVVGSLVRILEHRMEVRADARAGPAEESPGAYGRALARIYETNLVPVVLGMKRGTHPELYDRLAAAGARPDDPRPAAPPRGPFWAGLLVLTLGIIAGGFVVSDPIARRIPRAVLDPESAALWTAGAAGGSADDYFLWTGFDRDRGEDNG